VSDLWTFNGIDASSGAYLLQASPAEIVRVASRSEVDPRALGELKSRVFQAASNHLGLKAGHDARDLSDAGWGVVFPAVRPDSPEAKRQTAIVDAMGPLLAHRRVIASRRGELRYRQFTGEAGLRLNESKLEFLARHGAGPGPVDPDVVPYYLLLVGDPRELSFRFQSQLGVQHAVGRICFDTVEEYAHYARSVVAAETHTLVLPRRATFFSVVNPDDGATEASAHSLVRPLARQLASEPTLSEWTLHEVSEAAATRDALVRLLAHGEAPALLFTASHGVGFPVDHPLQLRHQGALLCQDWPGPKQWGRQPIPESHYFAGEHLPADADLLGTVAFMFACYSAGTPELDEFAAQAFKARARIAPEPFVAGLPKAMLGRARGSALAVIGHVERAWGHSFLWKAPGVPSKRRPQITAFSSALQSMMEGMPIGAAMKFFGERYAELASDLSVELERAEFGESIDEYEVAAMWTANNDARGYAIFGDPAVRVMTGEHLKLRGSIARETSHVSERLGGVADVSSTASVPANLREVVSECCKPDPPPTAPVVADPALLANMALEVLRCLHALPDVEVKTRGTNGTEIITRLKLGGDIEGTFSGSGEPSATLREHHETMVRAAIDGQIRMLKQILSRLSWDGVHRRS
jgi:hypothetical protein